MTFFSPLYIFFFLQSIADACRVSYQACMAVDRRQKRSQQSAQSKTEQRWHLTMTEYSEDHRLPQPETMASGDEPDLQLEITIIKTRKGNGHFSSSNNDWLIITRIQWIKQCRNKTACGRFCRLSRTRRRAVITNCLHFAKLRFGQNDNYLREGWRR